LHNDELHGLYSSPNIVRVVRSRRRRGAGHVAHMGEVFTGFWLGGKRTLGRPKFKWKDNIKMDLREIGIDGANWIWLAYDRVQWWSFVNTVVNLYVL
jgi:hypothetical protein